MDDYWDNDWSSYQRLADTPLRDYLWFAMSGAKKFGMKAMPILSTADVYGDDYPKLIQTACETSMSKNEPYGRVSDMDKEYAERAGVDTKKTPHFNLKDMAQYSESRTREINAQRLMEKLDNSIKPKVTQTIHRQMKL